MPLIMVFVALLVWATIGTVAAVLYGLGRITLGTVTVIGRGVHRLTRRTS